MSWLRANRHQSPHQSLSFPRGPLDMQSHSLPSPSQTKHPAHCCNRPGIDTAGHMPLCDETGTKHKLHQHTADQTSATKAARRKTHRLRQWHHVLTETSVFCFCFYHGWLNFNPITDSRWGFDVMLAVDQFIWREPNDILTHISNRNSNDHYYYYYRQLID